jgi:hypothetical protein
MKLNKWKKNDIKDKFKCEINILDQIDKENLRKSGEKPLKIKKWKNKNFVKKEEKVVLQPRCNLIIFKNFIDTIHQRGIT